MTLTQVEPRPSYPDEEMTNKLRDLYQLAKTTKGSLRSDWMRNNRMVNNKMNFPDNSVMGTPNVTDSEVFPIISSRIAWMTDQKILPNVVAAAPQGSTFSSHMTRLAEHLELILATQQEVGGWYLEIVQSIWDSAQCGAGVLKAEWDSGLDNGLGNVRIRRVDPWAFYPDPDATTLDNAQYLFEVQKMSFAEIERRFPSTSAALIEEAMSTGDPSTEDFRPRNYGQYQGNLPMAWPGVLPSGEGGGGGGGAYGLEGQGVRRHTDNVLQQAIAVYTCWIRQNYSFERETTDASLVDEEPVVTDSWRVIVYTGNHVLLDELAENLFQESRHPYVRFCDEELGDFWPTAICSHLAPCQTAINRLLSAIQGNAELTGNPIFLDVQNSGIARTQIFNRPGQRVTMNASAANSQGSKPGWIEPPKFSSDAMSTIQFWITRMENISGLSGPTKGDLPSGRQGGQTVQAAQEAGFVRIRSALRNLETALGILYTLVANLVIQNYDVPRVVAVVGEQGEDTALRLAARHFYMPRVNPGTGKVESVPMKFSLVVKAGSASPTSRQARIAEADALFAMHAIDAQAVLEAHQWPNPEVVLQRMQQQAMALEQAKGAAAGEAHGPGTGHEH